MIPCKECNGQGLVSTGANKLDLSVGNKVTCAACGGTGKVADPNAEQAESPKAQDPSQIAPGGGEPSDSGSGSEVVPTVQPKEGDPCVDGDGVSGYLGKDGDGKWVCVVG